jgi:hypothetical protein
VVAKILKSRILLYELGDQFIRGNQTLLGVKHLIQKYQLPAYSAGYKKIPIKANSTFGGAEV